jgi:hypothetical protein
MFLHHDNLVAVGNYLDIQWKNVLHDHVFLVHELFVLPFHGNNFLLEDEDDVHELILLDDVLQLHDV